MCGRFTLTPEASQILTAFPDLAVPDNLVPRYNVAPTDAVLVVTRRDHHRVLERMRWGLIPSWTKDVKRAPPLINARADSLNKPAFRAAFKKRRCLVLADGFYEWRKEGKKRRPFYVRLSSGAIFAFAGLWEVTKDSQGMWIPSCTIITTEPNDVVRPLHDRMPAILPPDFYDQWLDATVDEAWLQALLGPYPSDEMTAYEVSPLVNSPRDDSPSCIAPLGC